MWAMGGVREDERRDIPSHNILLCLVLRHGNSEGVYPMSEERYPERDGEAGSGTRFISTTRRVESSGRPK
jgi:hypothetical protein